jgi:oligoendopeptidase F
MTTLTIPDTIDGLDLCSWETYRPYFEELHTRELSAANTRQWLEDWSQLGRLVWEAIATVYNAKSLDTADEDKEKRYLTLVQEVIPPVDIAYQALKERVLALDVPDEDMVLVLRNLRNEAELFREENVPLQTRIRELGNDYDKLAGGLKATWQGEEKNLTQLREHLQSSDRSEREEAWRLIMGQWGGAREAINAIYAEMLSVRQQIALNAGMPDYRAYAFRELARFAYGPEDSLAFHEAIEQVVVPAAGRILEKKRRHAGYARLRPWDRVADIGYVFQSHRLPPLRPFEGQDELVAGVTRMLSGVDPVFADYMHTMASESLLDLETRSGKAMGGWCSTFPLRRRPFIFMNGIGIHDDVQTLLHEAGHAFHVFEGAQLPLVWHLETPIEFCEVASMAMELLAAPYLTRDRGGFYTDVDAARARLEHLEGIILFWPYMAVVDAFQHWVYTHPKEAADAAACDRCWGELWDRFEPGVDWSGFEAERVSGWHRKPHIYGSPFYYVEYGMAQVGALQVWRNSRSDSEGAVAAYRRALALGGTRTLPELFAAAGAEFRFDAPMLSELVGMVEETMAALEAEIGATA